MSYLLYLLKDHPELAVQEVKSIVGKPIRKKDNYLEMENIDGFERLALTRMGGKIIIRCLEHNLKKEFEKFDWNSIIKGSFYFEIWNASPFDRRELADIIWKKLEEPKADLYNPDTKIMLLQKKRTCYVLLNPVMNDEKFEQRRAHLRPAPHTASVHPKIARALINLTGIKRGTILDPFCGSGGILIEAALMGLNPVGYDIDSKVLAKAHKNLIHYCKDFQLHQRDALTLDETEYIASDLPYGRCTIMQVNLQKHFLEILQKKLQKRAALILPDWYRIGTLDINVVFEYSYYVHKSLTRRIIVIEP